MGWTLVTGGSRRLGAAIALALAKSGKDVLVHYNTSRNEAIEVVKQCIDCGANAAAVQGNLATAESSNEFFSMVSKSYGNVENLINNFGPYLVKSAANTNANELAYLYHTNVLLPFALIKYFLPSIIDHQGNIINIGVVGLNAARADTSRSVYMSAKMSMLMLTKSLARELAQTGVRVNMVSPGYLDNSVDLPKDLSKIPLGRPSTKEEITRVITFLLDPASASITGLNIEVGGGVNI